MSGLERATNSMIGFRGEVRAIAKLQAAKIKWHNPIR
jgi:hypothetical protein